MPIRHAFGFGKHVKVGASLLALALAVQSGWISSPSCYAMKDGKNDKTVEKRDKKKSKKSTSKGPETNSANRLPRDATPDTYRIFIEPDIENKQFSGEETIFLTVHETTRDIVLNAVALDLAEVEIATSGKEHGEWVAPERVIDDKAKQQVSFRFRDSLKPGKYELHMKFAGHLNEKLEGFYISTFTNAKGEKHKIASTQLEATDARKVFPCFDEPDMKATFKITLAIDPELVAISNGSVAFDKKEGRSGKRQITFNETPRMSTYLVVLVVGPFEATKPQVVNNVAIRIWATPGQLDQCGFAQAAASHMLPYFESYFGVKYPLEKLDLIAIPDFAAGAMENLGAVTFREARLLVDDKTASTASKQDVASVIAHEMAHMWFGDLVTMKWWDDLWLNEAFATWMSVKAMDDFKPEWHPWNLFVRDRAQALASDSLASTRSIYCPVQNPTEAEEMFDEITYEKGASVLRMLERFLGEETYKKGIQAYIKKHQFGNAQTRQLWDALEEASGKPVADIMDAWVYSAGYPLVTVSAQPPKANASKTKGKDDAPRVGRISLSQSYFTVSPTEKTGDAKRVKDERDKKERLWQIPVTARVLTDDGGKTEPVKLLLSERKRVVEYEPEAGKFFANSFADGYFRTQYDSEILDQIGKRLQSSLTPAERYQMLNDAWASVEAGSMAMSNYLAFTANYKEETDPNVVELLVSQIATLDWFVKDESRANFAAFVRDRFNPLCHKLGWEAQEGEGELTQMLRSHVLSAMGTYGQDGATKSEARKYWDIYLEKPEEINPNLYEAIVAIMAYNGDESVYKEMEQLFKNATTPEAKLRNLNGLAFFRKPDLQNHTLELALTDEVKTQDAPHIVLNLMKTSAGRELGWTFVKQHWKDMEARYPIHLFPRIVNGATSFVSAAQSSDLEKFLAEHPIKAGKRVAGKVIERVRSNVRLNERSAESLDNWLKDFKVRQSASASSVLAK